MAAAFGAGTFGISTGAFFGWSGPGTAGWKSVQEFSAALERRIQAYLRRTFMTAFSQ
jgi:hypothetical protein